MKTSDFYYDLPQELIAQDPLEERSSSRLLSLDLVCGTGSGTGDGREAALRVSGDCGVFESRGLPGGE